MKPLFPYHQAARRKAGDIIHKKFGGGVRAKIAKALHHSARAFLKRGTTNFLIIYKRNTLA